MFSDEDKVKSRIKEEESQRLEAQNRSIQGWEYENASRYYEQESFSKRAAIEMENCERIMREQRAVSEEYAGNGINGWKHKPLNNILIPGEINNVIGMIHSGFDFNYISNYIGYVIHTSVEYQGLEYSRLVRQKYEMRIAQENFDGLEDSQLQHQSIAPHQEIEEIPPMPMALYERFKKERDSLVIDKEKRVAVRKLSKGSE